MSGGGLMVRGRQPKSTATVVRDQGRAKPQPARSLKMTNDPLPRTSSYRKTPRTGEEESGLPGFHGPRAYPS